LVRLGKLYQESGEPQSVIDILSKLAEDDETQDVKVGDLYEAVKISRQVGQAKLAASLLRKTIDLNKAEVSKVDTPVQQSRLYAELATAYQENGDRRAALEALEQSIALEPNQISLHLQKADLLVEMDEPANALECLTQALQLDHNAADLHYRMAEVLNLTGELTEAFSHAQLAVTMAERSQETETLFTARLLAADLAYNMLRPQAAKVLLANTAPSAGTPADRFEYACLQAELALETGDIRLAAKPVETVRQLDAEHPRSLAVQARLANLRGDHERGEELLDSAEQALEAMQSEWEHLPLTPRRRLSAAVRGIIRGDRDFGRWEQAENHCHRRLRYAPREPMAQFQIAQVLVERAEWQNLCQALQVRQHAPGVQAVSEEAYRSFEQAIQESERQVQGIGILEGKEGVDLWKDEAWQAFYTWRARGMAAFYPGAQTVQALQEAMRSASPKPDDVAALMMALIAAGEHRRAVQALREEWIMHARHPLVMTVLALAMAPLNPRQGIEVAESAILQASRPGYTRCPEQPMLQFLVAWLAHLAGVHEKAWQFIQKALVAWPDEPRWHVLAADIAQLGERASSMEAELSLEHLQKAVALEPDYASHYLALGRAYQSKGEIDPAIQALDQASRLDAEQPEIWLALAQAQQAVGDLEQAAASAERAIEGLPEAVDPLLIRAELALQMDNPRGAFSRTQAALRIQPDHPQALYLLARCLEALDRPDEALTVLEKAMPLFHNPLPMFLERAHLLRRSRGLDACLAALQELEAEYPKDPELLALLAEWLMEAGKGEAAVQAAQSALQIDQDKFTRQRRAGLHSMIGVSMRRAGQLDQAIYHLNEAIGLVPDNYEAYLELGRSYQERRELKQALKVYQRAINLAGSDYRPYYLAGQVLKDSKDYLAAEAMLRKAAQLAPNEVSVHRLLGAVVALNLVHNRRLVPNEVQGS
jgi:tetratricopeptide (TPR) repeat protein